MRVVWTDAAIAQLKAIYKYVAETSPEYALRLVDRLTKTFLQIANSPLSGRKVPEFELNEIREVIEGSHRIICLIRETDEQIDVLAVIHSAREGHKFVE